MPFFCTDVLSYDSMHLRRDVGTPNLVAASSSLVANLDSVQVLHPYQIAGAILGLVLPALHWHGGIQTG